MTITETTLRRTIRAALNIAVAMLSISAPTGASANPQSQEKEPMENSPPSYVPGLGEMMLNRVQPRHIKLWLAGSRENWPLANYEFDELLEALDDIALYQTRWNGLEISEMLAATMSGPLKSIKVAIDAKDIARFKASYNLATQACNSCHGAAGRGFLTIRVPNRSPFPDQVFDSERD